MKKDKNSTNLPYKDLNNNFINYAVKKLTNKKITKNEEKLLNYLLNILYQFEYDELMASSSMIAFLMTGAGLDYPQVISSSINCFGKNHLCFTEMAEFILNGYKTDLKYYPGFGHPIFKKEDPRIIAITSKMQKLKIQSKNLEQSFVFAKEKNICLNIGGCCVAILLDLGFDKYTINYFPSISRILGLSLIYKKVKQNNLRFATSKDSIEKYKNLFQHSSIDNAKLS